MHRSSSTQRASDFFLHGASPASSSRGSDADELPMYDPLSEFAKKERIRMKFAENAVHAIPLILLLCAAVLWFCSSPYLDVMGKDGNVARIDGIDGDTDHVSVHGKMRILLATDLGDLDSTQKGVYSKPGRQIAF